MDREKNQTYLCTRMHLIRSCVHHFMVLDFYYEISWPVAAEFGQLSNIDTNYGSQGRCHLRSHRDSHRRKKSVAILRTHGFTLSPIVTAFGFCELQQKVRFEWAAV